MTEDNDTRDRILDDETRRSFMKKGTVATVGIGTFASGAGTAQDDGLLDEGWKALISADNFHPEGRFTFVSGVVEWRPSYGDVEDSWFSDYNTRMVRWLNTNQTVPMFVAQDANVGEFDEELGFVADVDDDPNQPQLFEVNREWTPFGDNSGLITINASPVPEEEEDDILDNEDWWQTGGDSGTTDGGNQTTPGGTQTTTNTTTTDGGS